MIRVLCCSFPRASFLIRTPLFLESGSRQRARAKEVLGGLSRHSHLLARTRDHNHHRNTGHGMISVGTASLITSLALNASIVLIQFDGSVRQPSDPGFPTHFLGRMVACAACIAVLGDRSCTIDSADAGNPTLSFSHLELESSWRMIGARSLDSGAIGNSAEAEYEGLLLGLEGLLNRQNDVLPATTEETRGSQTEPLLIIVQGDCKTVIRQMSGRSKSRKLVQYCESALSLLQQIRERSLVPVVFKFQHIPRSQNLLCDRLCSRIIHEQQRKEGEQAWENLRYLAPGAEERQQRLATNAACHSERESRQFFASECTNKQFLNRYLGDSQLSRVPISTRPGIYRRLAFEASFSRDYETLVALGKCLEAEAKNAWLINNSNKKTNSSENGHQRDEDQQRRIDGETLWAEALVFQILGLEALGKQKEAINVQRRNSYRLKKFSEYVTVLKHDFHSGHQPPRFLGLCYSPLHAKRDTCENWPPLARKWHDQAQHERPWTTKNAFWITR